MSERAHLPRWDIMASMPGDAVTGFILAGGGSRRMGSDKANLAWGDATLLDHMRGLLSEVCSELRVVGRDPLPDLTPDRGPLEGIRTALAVTGTEHNLIVAIDLPFLEPEFLAVLVDRLRAGSSEWVACRVDGRLPLCLGARRALRPRIEDYLDSGQRSLQEFAVTTPHDEVSAEQLHREGFGAGMFRNINTRDDYDQERPGTRTKRRNEFP